MAKKLEKIFESIIVFLARVITFVFTVIVIFLIGFPIIAMAVNNHVATGVMKDVKKIELPEKTAFVEGFSKADKLVGCGNGLQYLGGIVVKSSLPYEEIKEYYYEYAENDWEFIVENQEGQELEFIEHNGFQLKTPIDSNNYYIIYSWGSMDDANEFFYELDPRGH